MPESSGAPPRIERWFLILIASLVPVLLAVVLPEVARLPLFVIAGGLVVTGFALMVRTDRASRLGER
jgi:hypothetical protein